MKDKGKKAGMTLVIAVGPKMPKKPSDTAKPDMKKAFDAAWSVFKAVPEADAPGKPLIDAMGRPLSRANSNFDEHGLPYDDELSPEREYSDRIHDLSGQGYTTKPQMELEQLLDSGLFIDQEQLKRQRPDLFDMPNPMDRQEDPSPPRREVPPAATEYYQNAINDILSQVNRQNSPIERRSPPQRL